MTLAGPSMPHAYDNTQELYSQRYLDVLEDAQKTKATGKDGDISTSAAGDLAESVVRRSQVGKNRKHSLNSQGKKRQRKGVILPKLVEHLNITDRSNSVPVLFPPLPANVRDAGSWNLDSTHTLKLQSSSYLEEKTCSRDNNGALSNKEKAKRGIKKMKLPLPPKFALYRKMGVKNDRFYKAPEKLMDRTTKLDILEKKRPGHSVTQDKRKAAFMSTQALTQNYENIDFRPMLQAPGDDPISVRKKIEQFRRWHEEQYREKLEKLKIESKNHRGAETNKLGGKGNDLGKVDRVDNLTGVEIDFATRDHVGNGLLPYIPIPDDPIQLGRVIHNGCRQTPSPPARVPTDIRARPVSSTTWKTWRGLNESDAYDDVEKYIKDNELLSEEKRKHIADWVTDVERCSTVKPPDILTQLTDTTIHEETP